MNDAPPTNDLEFLKWLHQQLKVDEPLHPGNPLYEPIYTSVSDDPVELIYKSFSRAEVESLNFISGFRGSGKTTELFRLKKQLEDDGLFVAVARPDRDRGAGHAKCGDVDGQPSFRFEDPVLPHGLHRSAVVEVEAHGHDRHPHDLQRQDVEER